MKTDDLLAGLPGETLVRKGLVDLKSGRCTVAACLAAIARNRLVAAGAVADGELRPFPEPELDFSVGPRGLDSLSFNGQLPYDTGN